MNLWKSLTFWAVIFSLFLPISPVWAHHMTGGELPNTFLAGFMSGLAHPVIGLDHLASIVAVAVLGVLRPAGILIPIGFILSTTLGTGLHLLGLELPFLELVIASSVLLFGGFLLLKEQPDFLLTELLTIGAGLFHGYAYGEAIFGAETTPLISYLVGFSLIQAGIAIGTFWVVKNLSAPSYKPIGFIICGIGFSFVFNQVIDILLPGV
ncbi:MAG: HupE/UreJ family protein [Cyanobacteria bacterium KgW148]|nr:HupE/UreJ family protein [Cyanobacteria bacterium KgW148]